jgi:hypothetical protein
MDDEFEYHVRHRAYELWVKAGRPDGKHQDFWEEAERELKAQHKTQLNGSAAVSKPVPVDAPDDV